MPKEPPPPTFEQMLERLRTAGFEVLREGDRARIHKGKCAAVLALDPGGAVRLAAGPGFLLGSDIARLDDRGFQKYLVTHHLTRPALAEHLHEIHQFSEQMRAALGLVSLYNQALGTVSDRYLYDRLHGRDRDDASVQEPPAR